MACLHETILKGADLRWVDFDSACLIRANLRGAILQGTYFVESRFEDTCFTEALLSSTVFGNVNLQKVRGLCDWEIEAAKLSQPDLSSSDINDILETGSISCVLVRASRSMASLSHTLMQTVTSLTVWRPTSKAAAFASGETYIMRPPDRWKSFSTVPWSRIQRYC